MNKYFTAIDVLTGLRTRPLINEAYSNREYKCTDEKCNGKVIFCAEKSEKVTPYFRHVKSGYNSDYNCTRYSSCNIKTIHDEAIRVLKIILLDKSGLLIINKPCKLYGNRCGFITQCELDKLGVNDELIIESNYDHKHRADLAWFRDGKLYKVFEIKYTHSTEESARLGLSWYELDAEEILKCEKNEDNEYVLNCIRNTKLENVCEECSSRHEKHCIEREEIKKQREEISKKQQEEELLKQSEQSKQLLKQSEQQKQLKKQQEDMNKFAIESRLFFHEQREQKKHKELEEYQIQMEESNRCELKFNETVKEKCCNKCNYLKMNSKMLQLSCGYCRQTYTIINHILQIEKF